MAAVIEAATRLLAARGPAAISVRDIARAARVNHALVHRHFGTKVGVIRAAQERAGRELADAVDRLGDLGSAGTLLEAAVDHETQLRALARLMLDGEDPGRLFQRFPAFESLRALVGARRAAGPPRPAAGPPPRRSPHRRALRDPRAVAAAAAGLVLGWVVFERFLLTASGFAPAEREAARSELARVLDGVLEAG